MRMEGTVGIVENNKTLAEAIQAFKECGECGKPTENVIVVGIERGLYLKYCADCVGEAIHSIKMEYDYAGPEQAI